MPSIKPGKSMPDTWAEYSTSSEVQLCAGPFCYGAHSD
jgi:hypothetical protein